MIELTFAGLLLASVSFLTYLPPAKIAALSASIARTAKVDGLRLGISIAPGRVGQNTFTLRIATEDGAPLYAAKKVLLRFTAQQPSIPPSELELISQGDGSYTARGTYLSSPGAWHVQAVVRRDDHFDAFANFKVTLQKPGTARASAAIPRQAGLLLLCLGGLCATLTFSSGERSALRFGAGIPLTLLTIGLGIAHLARPAPLSLEQANPVPPGRESIAAGQALFTTNCVPCHGITGKGDGPVGLTLNPRPADLTQHAVPGVHTDAQLFEWITNGFPGSQMPAFRSSLSDTDRWNLVNYMRTLAPQ